MSKLKKTYDVFQYILTISGYIVISIVILFLVYICIEAMGVPFKEWGVASILGAIAKYLFFSAVALWFLSALIAYFIGKRLGIDEEKQQRIEDLKEAMQALQEEKKQEARKRTRNVESPLDGLTDKQIAVVHEVLLSIPTNEKGIIRNSELMGLIHALDADGNLKKNFSLQDIVDWVEELREPDKVDPRFVSEYAYRPAESTITKMGNMVRRGFDKLR